jgi:carbon-monoxide dehydrogenase large subunit
MGAKWFGAAVKRKEDPELLAGRGRFIDDVRLPGTLHAAFVRSAYPHAKIPAGRTALDQSQLLQNTTQN